MKVRESLDEPGKLEIVFPTPPGTRVVVVSEEDALRLWNELGRVLGRRRLSRRSRP